MINRMHTRLMGICVLYIIGLSILLGITGLATFPPEPLTYAIPQQLQGIIHIADFQLSWESVISAIVVFTIAVVVIVTLADIEIFGSGFDFDAKFITRLSLGIGLGGAISSTMIFMVQDLIPSWIQLVIIYAPSLMLIYSIISEA